MMTDRETPLLRVGKAASRLGLHPLRSLRLDFGFAYLQARFTVCEVYMTILHSPDVLVPEQALVEDLHALLTARSQPSDG